MSGDWGTGSGRDDDGLPPNEGQEGGPWGPPAGGEQGQPGWGAPPPGGQPPPPQQPGWGTPPPGYGAPPPGYGQPGYGAPPGYGYQWQQPPPFAKPDSYLVWAIVATVLCCLPFGIVGIVYAAQVDSKWATGDWLGAKAASDKARTWSYVSIGAGLVVVVAYVVIIAAAAFSGSSSY